MYFWNFSEILWAKRAESQIQGLFSALPLIKDPAYGALYSTHTNRGVMMMHNDRHSVRNVARWQEDCLSKPPVFTVLSIQVRCGEQLTSPVCPLYQQEPPCLWLFTRVSSAFLFSLRVYEPRWFPQILLLLNMSFVSSKEILWISSQSSPGRMHLQQVALCLLANWCAKHSKDWIQSGESWSTGRISMVKGRKFSHWLHYLLWVIFSSLFLTVESIILWNKLPPEPPDLNVRLEGEYACFLVGTSLRWQSRNSGELLQSVISTPMMPFSSF